MSFLRAFLFLSFAFTAAWGPAASAQTITCGTSQVFTGTGSAATGLWRNAFTSNGVSYDLFASVTARTQARTSFFRCTDSGGIQVPTVSLRDNNNDPGAENNRLSVRFQIREAGTTTPVALPQVVFQMNDLDLTNGTLEVFALDIGDNYCFTSGGQIAVSEVPPQTLFSGTVNNPTDAVQVNFSNRTEFNFEVRSNDDGERHYKLSATDTSNLFDTCVGCGDGILDAGETCDDGNWDAGDGCSASCLLEVDIVCGNNAQCDSGLCDPSGVCTCTRDLDCFGTEICDETSAPASCEPINTCGNGRIETGEVCDDGNTLNGDGCTALCQFNTAPLNTVPGAQTTAEDTTRVFSVANGNGISVSDVDGDQLTVTLTGTLGTLTLAGTTGLTFTTGDGTADATMTFRGTAAAITTALNGLSFIPNANVSGAGQVAISTTDGALTDADTIAVTITAVNDAPTATNDTATVAEDSGATVVNVLANDSFAPDVGETLTVTAVTQPVNGAVTLTGGVVRFTPAANFNGTTSFSYTIADGNGGTATGTVAVTVTSVNDAPTATNDTVTVAEDSGATVVNVLANDSFAPDVGETLTVTAVTQPANGAVTLTGGVVRFTPAANFNGTTSFSYTISDGNGGTATGTVTVTVTSVNDAPTATNDTVTVAEDSGATVVNVLANDSIAPDVGETLTVTAVTQPANGTVTLTGGVVRFTPAANFTGTSTFTVTISDGNGGTATSTVTVTVTAANDAPIVSVPGEQNLDEDTQVTFIAADGNAITVADVDGDELTVSLAVTDGVLILGDAVAATIVAGADNSSTVTLRGSAAEINVALEALRFVPDANFNGDVNLVVNASDGSLSDQESVLLDVTSINDVPVPVDDSATATIDPIDVDVLANDRDVDNDPLSIASIDTVVGGTATIVGGQIRFTPTRGSSGTATVTFTVSDGRGGSATSTLTITVDGDRDDDGIPDVDDNCDDLASLDQTDTDGDGLGDVCDPDDDNDGEPDVTDNCDLVAGAQTDTDGDGLGDVCDDDDDNDGDPDVDDNCDLVVNADQADNDGDGLGDACDDDDDNDGEPDVTDTCDFVAGAQTDTDGDGLGDICDDDDDDDGEPDVTDTCDLIAGAQTDTDGDGLGDICDDDDDNDDDLDVDDNCDLIVNADQANTDGDALGDACDDDDDNDGEPDVTDNCDLVAGAQTDTDGDGLGDVCDDDDDNDGDLDVDDNCRLVVNADQADSDGDGIGDACEGDRDGDGVVDDDDNCPDDANADQANNDGDDAGDVCDDDDDNDGDLDVDDNCDFATNADQADNDGDGIGDACDDDDDNDGDLDVDDNCQFDANADQADLDGDDLGDVCDDDRDGDDVPDTEDNCITVANADQVDVDNDNIGDACDPDVDQDGDGFDDGEDNCPGVENPDQLDTDNDRDGDACDEDDDNDGDDDGNDNCPLIANADQIDTDTDGDGDACDDDDDNDGEDDGVDNCPFVANADQVDTDSDGDGDVCDDDDDNDGNDDGDDNCPLVANADQADSDNDGDGDACDGDRDGDGVGNDDDNCPDVNNNDQADTDSDGDGDACDSDRDGDGVDNDDDNCPDVDNADQADADSDGEGDACDEPVVDGDGDGDGVLDLNDNCPDDDNADQSDLDLDGIGDVCDDENPAILVGGGGVVAGCGQTDAPSFGFFGLALVALVGRRRRR
jgi:hypothetical protein